MEIALLVQEFYYFHFLWWCVFYVFVQEVNNMVVIIIFCIAVLIVLCLVVWNILTKPKSNKKYMFSNEDMDHITIDGVGGLHFDIDYFMKQPRFKEQIKHALECFEEEEGEEVT
jgi:ABC-type transport system involved in cytochrome bd biosynthesis fused ATPase/permease subunit